LPWAALYCASKFALHAVNDSLRRELRDAGIHVMKVCPGIVATGFRDHVLAGSAPGGVEDIKRVVTPDQVAVGILRGIERRRLNVYVPWLSKAFMSVDFVAPRVMDWYCRRTGN
jgi:short-subunit dehydrogenase